MESIKDNSVVGKRLEAIIKLEDIIKEAGQGSDADYIFCSSYYSIIFFMFMWTINYSQN